MKRVKNFKALSSSLFMIPFLVGFGMGYTAKEIIQPCQDVSPSKSQVISLKGDHSVSVCFTPNKQCQSQIIREIDKAVKSIYVQAYSFTDRDIANALVRAAKRGVDVKVLLDKSNRNNEQSAKDIIIQNGLLLRFDSPSGIAHNKIIIIDAHTVISGSYNFSAAAYKRNTENLLILYNVPLAKEYSQNWQARWEVSQ